MHLAITFYTQNFSKTAITMGNFYIVSMHRSYKKSYTTIPTMTQASLLWITQKVHEKLNMLSNNLFHSFRGHRNNFAISVWQQEQS